MSTSGSDVGRRSIIYIVATTLQKLSSVVLLPIYTRLFTPEEYGYFNLIVTFTLFAGALGLFGLDYAVMRFCHKGLFANDALGRCESEIEVAGRYFTASIALVAAFSTIVTLLLVMGSPIYGHIVFPGLPLYPVITIALLALLFQPLTMLYLAQLQAQTRARAFGYYSVAYFVSNALLTIGLVGGLQLGLLGTTVAILTVNIIFALAALIDSWRRGLLWHRFDRKSVMQLLHYSFPMLPHSLSLQATSLVTRVTISNFISVAAAGLFNVAMYAVNFIDAIQTALHRAYLPWYFSRSERRDSSWRAEVHEMVIAFIAINVVSSIGVSLFAYECLLLLAPPSFLEAAAIVPVLALSMMIKSIYYPELSVLLSESTGTRRVLAISLSSSAASVVLGVIGALWLGLLGVAISQVIQRSLMSALAVALARRANGPGMPWLRIFRLQGFGLLAIASVLVGDGYNWWGLNEGAVAGLKSVSLVVLVCALVLSEPRLLEVARRVVVRRGGRAET